jgi:hypothetical protein
MIEPLTSSSAAHNQLNKSGALVTLHGNYVLYCMSAIEIRNDGNRRQINCNLEMVLQYMIKLQHFSCLIHVFFSNSSVHAIILPLTVLIEYLWPKKVIYVAVFAVASTPLYRRCRVCLSTYHGL